MNGVRSYFFFTAKHTWNICFHFNWCCWVLKKKFLYNLKSIVKISNINKNTNLIFIIASAGEHKCSSCIHKFHNCFLSCITDKGGKLFLLYLEEFEAAQCRHQYHKFVLLFELHNWLKSDIPPRAMQLATNFQLKLKRFYHICVCITNLNIMHQIFNELYLQSSNGSTNMHLLSPWVV